MGKEKLIGSCEAYSLVPIFTMSRQALQNFFVVVVKKNLFPHAIIILRFFFFFSISGHVHHFVYSV